MIEALHTGMIYIVSVGEEVSESVSITNGVKLGCVLTPTLFSIFLSAMLDEAFRDMGDGVCIQYRESADLFNVAHFRAKNKTTRILMKELLYADDSALVAHSAEEMQNIVWMLSPMRQTSSARRLTSRRPTCCTNPTL